VLRARGIDVGVMKPIETGCPGRRGRLVPRDALILREAAGSRDELDLINLYRFRAPLAPMVASEREGRPIDLRWVGEQFAHLASRHQVVLVEGAGGLMVPLTERAAILDLAGLLRLPLILVIGSRLGAINHGRLTVDAAVRARLPVVGAILNRTTRDRSLAVATNRSALARLMPIPIVAEIPFLSSVGGRLPWRDPRLQRLLTRSLPQLLPALADSGRPR
jgi:dethiobiotin synthetase